MPPISFNKITTNVPERASFTLWFFVDFVTLLRKN
jgi:hypothetical protein